MANPSPSLTLKPPPPPVPLRFSHIQFFSGEIKPYSPHHLLHSVWTHAHHLAGYEQQDAHEFFIAFLNGMHMHCQGV